MHGWLVLVLKTPFLMEHIFVCIIIASTDYVLDLSVFVLEASRLSRGSSRDLSLRQELCSDKECCWTTFCLRHIDSTMIQACGCVPPHEASCTGSRAKNVVRREHSIYCLSPVRRSDRSPRITTSCKLEAIRHGPRQQQQQAIVHQQQQQGAEWSFIETADTRSGVPFHNWPA